MRNVVSRIVLPLILFSLLSSAAMAANTATVTLPSGQQAVANEVIVHLMVPPQSTAMMATAMTGVPAFDAVSRSQGAISIRPALRTAPADKVLASALGLDNAYVVTIGPGRNVTSAASAYMRSGVVLGAEPNIMMHAVLIPNDTYYASRQWGPQRMDCPAAWDLTTGSPDVIVAITDTGVDYNHPELASKLVLPGYNALDGTSNAQDDFGHGTHVAGIAAAIGNNAAGIAGIAWGVKILPVKVLDSTGSGSNSAVAGGITWAADHGAQVINLSLGSSGGSSLLQAAVDYAHAKNVVVVAAAGNDGLTTMFYPAAYGNCISVAASNTNDSRASFSNYGNWVDVAAPGNSIYSTTPTGPVTMSRQGLAKNYDYMSGTSMASPHVAGLAALVYSKLGDLATADLVRHYVEQGCVATPGVAYTLHGRVDAYNSLNGIVQTTTAPAGWINPGWNWISFPLQPTHSDAADILGLSVVNNNLFRWNAVTKNIELYPNDFTDVASGVGYLLFSASTTVNPSYLGAANADGFAISVPDAGWTWIGQPYDLVSPQSGVVVVNNTTLQQRTAAQDLAAPDPWINWNWLYWNSYIDSTEILNFSGGSDSTVLQPWYGYRVWSNVGNLTLIMHK